MDRLKPQVQRGVAVLKNAAHFYRERLKALVALTQAGTRSLAIQATDLLSRAVAAVRANRTVWPQKCLNVLVGGFFVVEVGCVEN